MQSLLPIDWELIIRLVVAAGLGYVIGLERKLRGQIAGERTHALVALGAALFTVAGSQAFTNVDPTRVAAAVVTGVGFLCAGVVFRGQGKEIHGLTTAAGLWTVGAIGVAVGSGLFGLGIVAAGLVFIILGSESVLRLDQRIENRRKAHKKQNSKPPDNIEK